MVQNNLENLRKGRSSTKGKIARRTTEAQEGYFLTSVYQVTCVIGPEETPLLVWGGLKRPQSKMGSPKGHLPSKVFFRQRSSSVKARLPSKVVFRQTLSSSTLTVTVYCTVIF